MTEKQLRIKSPLADADIARLKTGMSVLITGTIYVARDAAHRRLVERQGPPAEAALFALLGDEVLAGYLEFLFLGIA